MSIASLRVPVISGKVVALILYIPFADIIVGNYVKTLIPLERDTVVVMNGQKTSQECGQCGLLRVHFQDVDSTVGDSVELIKHDSTGLANITVSETSGLI